MKSNITVKVTLKPTKLRVKK